MHKTHAEPTFTSSHGHSPTLDAIQSSTYGPPKDNSHGITKPWTPIPSHKPSVSCITNFAKPEMNYSTPPSIYYSTRNHGGRNRGTHSSSSKRHTESPNQDHQYSTVLPHFVVDLPHKTATPQHSTTSPAIYPFHHSVQGTRTHRKQPITDYQPPALDFSGISDSENF